MKIPYVENKNGKLFSFSRHDYEENIDVDGNHLKMEEVKYKFIWRHKSTHIECYQPRECSGIQEFYWCYTLKCNIPKIIVENGNDWEKIEIKE